MRYVSEGFVAEDRDQIVPHHTKGEARLLRYQNLVLRAIKQSVPGPDVQFTVGTASILGLNDSENTTEQAASELTQSSPPYEAITTWLDKCEGQHVLCHQHTNSDFVPTRLIASMETQIPYG